jgi:osmoprotectant transport system permease protein
MRGNFLVAVVVIIASCGAVRGAVRVGSKLDTESVTLGEVASEVIRQSGQAVEFRKQLGGTRVVWEALVAGQIDVYPEYSGTIAQEIFAGKISTDEKSLRDALAKVGIGMTGPLGFNNSYAIGMRRMDAERLKMRTISDLRAHPELRLGFSNEFMNRADGWKGLREKYGLPQQGVKGMEHTLANRALASGSIDATDLYTTDAEIAAFDLRALEDDQHYFPEYKALYLYRLQMAKDIPLVVAALRKLEGRISEGEMIRMNARSKLEKVANEQIAATFVQNLFGGGPVRGGRESMWRQIGQRTAEHLYLVGISLLMAIAVGLPMGVIAAKVRWLGRWILGVVAAIYTIPSLALLVFFIPLLGIGALPAIVALFLYSLLPIVRNTHAGLVGIPVPLRESAEAMGLASWTKLSRVELPLALGPILAGIKTAAVINVGTATLGALISAGGYGQPILSGITLYDVPLILQGAIPAALMALCVQALFELAERLMVPAGLRGNGRGRG